jgi:hypothetical protein
VPGARLGRVLPNGRLDFLPTLAAQDTDESSHGVRLPASGLHDLGKSSALGRFIMAMISAFLLVRSAFGLLVAFLARRFLRGLGFLARLAGAFVLRRNNGRSTPKRNRSLANNYADRAF